MVGWFGICSWQFRSNQFGSKLRDVEALRAIPIRLTERTHVAVRSHDLAPDAVRRAKRGDEILPVWRHSLIQPESVPYDLSVARVRTSSRYHGVDVGLRHPGVA